MRLEAQGIIYTLVLIGIFSLVEKRLIGAKCIYGREKIRSIHENCQRRHSTEADVANCINYRCSRPTGCLCSNVHGGGPGKRSGNFILDAPAERHFYEIPQSMMWQNPPNDNPLDTLFDDNYSSKTAEAAEVDLQDIPRSKSTEELLYALIPVEKGSKYADVNPIFTYKEANEDDWTL